ncbi:hypothetical protein FHD46_10050 [Escherichia coli]|nr:hypothetical protein [Escherichia coli]
MHHHARENCWHNKYILSATNNICSECQYPLKASVWLFSCGIKIALFSHRIHNLFILCIS